MTTPTDADAPPPFQRPLKVSEFARATETQVRITAEPEERAALARYLDVDDIERLTFAGFIAPHGSDGWRVRGRMVAKVVQTCVVTLEPVHTRIEEDIERVYMPGSPSRQQHEIVLLHDEADTPDPFTDTIDPAQLVVETLSLLIDPYPRREGAALDPALLAEHSDDAADDHVERPFSNLAALLQRSRPDES